ncbi:hypothetical protein C8F01DRAFT_1097119 [Mycena amicta]|nr:hypothetical protein C8F01DRAFT_1097119 [Mycena amicta]
MCTDYPRRCKQYPEPRPRRKTDAVVASPQERKKLVGLPVVTSIGDPGKRKVGARMGRFKALVNHRIKISSMIIAPLGRSNVEFSELLRKVTSEWSNQEKGITGADHIATMPTPSFLPTIICSVRESCPAGHRASQSHMRGPTTLAEQLLASFIRFDSRKAATEARDN